MTVDTSITRFLENPSNIDPQEIARDVVREMERTGDIHIGIQFVCLVHNLRSALDGTLDTVIQPMETRYEEGDLKKEYGGMSFYDMMTYMTPLSRETVHRHSRFKKILEKVPEEVRPRIEILGVKEKNQLLSIVEEEYEISPNQWNRIAEAPSHQIVGEVVREIRGVEPRNQLCMFRRDKDGVMWVTTNIGTFPCFEPKQFDNPEIQEKMDWVYEKIARQLKATPK